MSYQPSTPPQNIESIQQFLSDELKKIQQVVNSPRIKSIQLEVHNVVPDKPRDYVVVAADGTNWNPGSGQGVYTYYASAWHFLG